MGNQFYRLIEQTPPRVGLAVFFFGFPRWFLFSNSFPLSQDLSCIPRPPGPTNIPTFRPTQIFFSFGWTPFPLFDHFPQSFSLFSLFTIFLCSATNEVLCGYSISFEDPWSFLPDLGCIYSLPWRYSWLFLSAVAFSFPVGLPDFFIFVRFPDDSSGPAPFFSTTLPSPLDFFLFFFLCGVPPRVCCKFGFFPICLPFRALGNCFSLLASMILYMFSFVGLCCRLGFPFLNWILFFFLFVVARIGRFPTFLWACFPFLKFSFRGVVSPLCFPRSFFFSSLEKLFPFFSLSYSRLPQIVLLLSVLMFFSEFFADFFISQLFSGRSPSRPTQVAP